MHFHVGHLIHHYGYFAIFIILLVEMIGVPLPAETTLTIAGIALLKGQFTLFPLVLSAVSGNLIGSSITYGIGRLLGKTVILRYGNLFGLSEKRLAKAEKLFLKRRIVILVFSKFIAGIRVFTPYLAGLNGISFVIFSLYNAISAVLWVCAFVFLGHYLDVAWSHYHELMHQYFLPVLLISLMFVGVVIFAKTQRKRKTDP